MYVFTLDRQAEANNGKRATVGSHIFIGEYVLFLPRCTVFFYIFEFK